MIVIRRYLVVGGISTILLSMWAFASPSATATGATANVATTTRSAADLPSGSDLLASPTDCGGVNNTSYSPPQGLPMTAADFAALGMQQPPPGSPMTATGTQWVVPQCDSIPDGEQPGGPTSPSNSGSSTMQASPNWVGFQSNNSTTYSGAYNEWFIPSSFSAPPGDTYESSWAGIGSGSSSSDALLQAGTETDVTATGNVTNYAWWEFYPMNSQQIYSLSVYSGSTDLAEVEHTGSGQGTANICTEPAGSGTFTCTGIILISWGSGCSIDTSQFECIAERTEIGVYLDRLTDIAGIQFSNCEGYNGNWLLIGDIDRYYYYMAKTQTAAYCYTSPWAAETGDIYNDADFGINWYGYGYPIEASECGL